MLNLNRCHPAILGDGEMCQEGFERVEGSMRMSGMRKWSAG